MIVMRSFLLALMALSLPVMAGAALAQDTPSGLPVPRFVSLKVGVANGRAGPQQAHPILWRYVRTGLPMEIVAETPEWRRVRDPEGELTWVHNSLLSGRRSVYVLSETALRARPRDDAPEEAIAETGAILWLERCRDGWCRLEAQGRRGWARTETLWGVYTHEGDPSTLSNVTAALSDPLAHDTAPD